MPPGFWHVLKKLWLAGSTYNCPVNSLG
jgi:hypothetical protein